MSFGNTKSNDKSPPSAESKLEAVDTVPAPPGDKPPGKYRAYMVTINNPTEDEEKSFKDHECRYYVYQIEKGAEGTTHLQGFVYYENPRVWPKKHFPRAHLEAARNVKTCIRYCKKEETRVRGPYEKGESPMQGKRSDLEYIGELITKGVEMKEIAVEFPGKVIQYGRGMERLATMIMPKRTRKPLITWLWGKAGVGKSRFPREHCPKDWSIYVKDSTMWWDGYTGQKIVIIEDFDGKWPFRDLLRCLDRYEYQGQVKGGYVPIAPQEIYITCEFDPSHFWSRDTYEFDGRTKTLGDTNMLDQVLRRIDHVVEVIGDKSSVVMATHSRVRWDPESEEYFDCVLDANPDFEKHNAVLSPKDGKEVLAEMLK